METHTETLLANVLRQDLNSAGQIIIASIKEDPTREGLRETPKRFSKAIKELCSGYELTLEDVVGRGIFESEGSGLVTVKDIEYHSLCEHHLLPFWGKASVAYYPHTKIIGLSKIPRIVDMYSRRLQVQERLTHQITSAIMEVLKPKAVFVRISGCHMCMMMRGVKKQESETITEHSMYSQTLTEIETQRAWHSLE